MQVLINRSIALSNDWVLDNLWGVSRLGHIFSNLPGNFENNSVFDLGHSALLVAQVHPHTRVVVLVLEAKNELTLEGEVILNIS